MALAVSLKPREDIWSMHNFHLVMNNSPSYCCFCQPACLPACQSLAVCIRLLIFSFPLFYGPIPKHCLDIRKTMDIIRREHSSWVPPLQGDNNNTGSNSFKYKEQQMKPLHSQPGLSSVAVSTSFCSKIYSFPWNLYHCLHKIAIYNYEKTGRQGNDDRAARLSGKFRLKISSNGEMEQNTKEKTCLH